MSATGDLLFASMTSSVLEPANVPFTTSRPVSRSAGGLGSLGLCSPMWNAPRYERSRSASRLRSVDGNSSAIISGEPIEFDQASSLRRSVSLRLERSFGGHFYTPSVSVESKFLCHEQRSDPYHQARINLVQETIRRRRAEAAARGETRRPVMRRKDTSGMDPKKLAKLRRKLAQQAIREHAMAVVCGDDDGDFSLDYDEFVAIVKRRLPDLSFTTKTLRQWHRALDDDNGGTIALPEYFAFALREALLRVDYVYPEAGFVPQAVERQRWFDILFGKSPGVDSEEGVISRDGLTKFAENVGFGDAADMLFDTLTQWDTPGDGGKVGELCDASDDDSDDGGANGDGEKELKIDGHGLLRAMHARTSGVRPLIQAWARIAASGGGNANAAQGTKGAKGKGGGDEADEAPPPVPTMDEATRAELTALSNDVPGLLARLREWLRGDGSKNAIEQTMQVFKSFDADGSMEISLKEMRQGLSAMGYEGPKEVLEGIFDAIDEDATYKIGFSEFKAWIAPRPVGDAVG